MIGQINNIAEIWWAWMWPMFWQVGVLVALIWLVDLVIRAKVWPQVRYALWLLVLVKLVLPPTFSLSTSVTSQLRPLVEGVIKQQEGVKEIATFSYMGEDSTAFEPSFDRTVEPIVVPRESKSSDAVELSAVTSAGGLTAEAEGERLSWRVYVMGAWLVGAVILAVLLMARFRQLRQAHRGRKGRTDVPDWLSELLADTAKRLNLRRTPEVALSRKVTSPAVFGVFRPVLLLPEENIAGFSRKDFEHVLLHELAHLKRGDLWVHSVYMVLQIIYWFNPLLWFVRRQLQHLRELCCDATVAGILRERTVDYRETVVETARRLLDRPTKPGMGLLGLFEDSNRLLVRLKWLEKKTWRHRALRIVTIFTVVALMFACILPMAKARHVATASETDEDLTLSQSREGSVTGTVRFHGTDAPASGVVVKTISKWFDTVQSRTDQQGSYTLAGIRPEAVFHISAEDEQKELFIIDMPAAVLKPGEAKTGVDLTLYQGRQGSISGKVVGRRIFYKKPERLTRNIVPENFERRQDSPLSGVKIVLKSNKGVLKETITDETGRYRFEGLRADGYTVRVEQPAGVVAETVRTLPMAGPGRAEGHGSSQSRWVELKSEPKTDIDFHFRLDWVSISGRVTDADGNPVSGVKVGAELCSPKMDGGEGRSGAFSTIKISWGSVSTISDEDGRYRLDGLCPVTFSETATYLIHGKLHRRYEVRIQAEGYSPARFLVPPVTEHLVGETSRLMEDYKGLYGERDSSSAEVALPETAANAINGIDFVMEKAAVITGRVLDTQGNIVPGPRQKALVRMVFADSRDDKSEKLLVQMPDMPDLDWIILDEAGRFKFDGVHAGSYSFEIRTGIDPYDTQRSRNETLVVKAGDVIKDLDVIKNLDVIVEPAADRGKISGRALDARSGKPVEAFSAKVTRVDSSGEGTLALGRTTIDKLQEGAFLIEDISTGTATLEVSAPGYAREKAQVEVVSGQTTDMTFNLEQGGKLQVYVTLNGKGKMAWVVSARPAGEGPDAEISTQMGKDGRYELTGLKEAEYLVRAPVPLSTGVRGRATVQINNRARVKIEPKKETRLDFELRDNAGIRGAFTGPDKDLSWRILVFDNSAVVRDDSVSEVRQAHALIWNLQKGKYYEITCLPPGTYRVVGRCCKKDQGWTPLMEKSKTVTVGVGQVAEVDFVFP